MQLYLIRHAQSENNALWEQTGYSLGRRMDPELTELGCSQAQLLARFLAQGNPDLDGAVDPHNRLGFGLTHLYSSLMVRAVATGCIVAQELELPLLGWPDWHEGGGIYLEDEDTGELIGYPGKDRFVMSNAAITRIDFSADEVRLIYQNRLDFMPSELLTAG